MSSDATASTDPDATPIASYTFEFGDGTVVGPQPGATATHTYATTGTYTISVTATDTAGLTSTAATAGLTVTASVNLVGNPGFETDLTGGTPPVPMSVPRSRESPTLTRVRGRHRSRTPPAAARRAR